MTTITELAKQIEEEGPRLEPSILPAPFANAEITHKEEDMAKIGPKEAALRAARDEDLSIPAALDRTRGLSKEQIAKIGEQAVKNATKALKGKDSKLKPTKAIRPRLTEADKKAIAEIKAEEKKRAEKKKAESLAKLKAANAEKKAVRDAARAAKAPQKAAGAPEPARKGKADKTRKPAPAASAAQKGGKLAIIGDLLRRKEGCTSADVLKATGWPAVSMPQQAQMLGVSLRKEKQGKVSRYWAI